MTFSATCPASLASLPAAVASPAAFAPPAILPTAAAISGTFFRTLLANHLAVDPTGTKLEPTLTASPITLAAPGDTPALLAQCSATAPFTSPKAVNGAVMACNSSMTMDLARLRVASDSLIAPPGLFFSLPDDTGL